MHQSTGARQRAEWIAFALTLSIWKRLNRTAAAKPYDRGYLGTSLDTRRAAVGLFRDVFLDSFFDDFNPEARAGGDRDVAVLDLKRIGHDFIAERVFEHVEFEHRLIAGEAPGIGGQEREHLQRGGDGDRARPAMRDALHAEDPGHFGNKQHFGHAAAERHVGLDDVERPLDDVVPRRRP